MINPFGAQGEAEDIGVNVVEATFNVKEEQRDFEGRALQCTHCVCEGGACIKGGKRAERATLIVMKEVNVSGDGGETGSNDPFHDLRNALKENNDAK